MMAICTLQHRTGEFAPTCIARPLLIYLTTIEADSPVNPALLSVISSLYTITMTVLNAAIKQGTLPVRRGWSIAQQLMYC